MKRLPMFLFPLLLATAHAAPQEVQLLDNLITSTQETVETCKTLRQSIVEYLALQDNYLANPTDTACCENIVAMANSILKRINDNHLQDAFSQDFLNELNTLATLGDTAPTS